MISRFKKIEKPIHLRLNQEHFLTEHSRLSPVKLKATMASLSRFKIEKATLFKNDHWSIDKMRKPFISWLMASAVVETEINSNL